MPRGRSQSRIPGGTSAQPYTNQNRSQRSNATPVDQPEKDILEKANEELKSILRQHDQELKKLRQDVKSLKQDVQRLENIVSKSSSLPIQSVVQEPQPSTSWRCAHVENTSRGTANEVKELRTKLLKMINDRPNTDEFNLLLLGPAGVGKSSLINSLVMSFDTNNDECDEIAHRGSYGQGGYHGRGAYTSSLRCFNMKILTKSKMQVCVKVWDFPGLLDSRDDKTKKILSLILDGCVAEKTVYQHLRDKNEEELKWLKTKKNEDRVIHMVAYVHAALDETNQNLVDCVHSVVRDPARELPIILVISKEDRVTTEDDKTNLNNTKKAITDTLGLHGSDEKVFHITNYCQETTDSMKRSEELDKNLLHLWRCILAYEKYKMQRPCTPKAWYNILRYISPENISELSQALGGFLRGTWQAFWNRS